VENQFHSHAAVAEALQGSGGTRLS
jgi:hypothetical protein